MSTDNHVSIFMGDYHDILNGVKLKGNPISGICLKLDWKTGIFFKSLKDLEEFVRMIQIGIEDIKTIKNEKEED